MNGARSPRRGNQRRGQLEAPGHYRTFYLKAWSTAQQRALSDVAEHVYIKLTVGPKTCSLPGLIFLGRGAVGDLFKYSTTVLDEALIELKQVGKLLIDWEHQVIWGPAALYEQQYVASPKTATGWCSNITNVPAECPLRDRVIGDVAAYLAKLGPNFLQSLINLVGERVPEALLQSLIPYQEGYDEPSPIPTAPSGTAAETQAASTVTGEHRDDGVTDDDFRAFIRNNNVAAALTPSQAQDFALLPTTNKTRDHFAAALERLRQRQTETSVGNPVGYMLRIIGSLPPKLEIRAARPPLCAAELEDIRQRWWRELNLVSLSKECAKVLHESGIVPADARTFLAAREAEDCPDAMQQLIDHAKALRERREAS